MNIGPMESSGPKKLSDHISILSRVQLSLYSLLATHFECSRKSVITHSRERAIYLRVDSSFYVYTASISIAAAVLAKTISNWLPEIEKYTQIGWF